MNRFLPLPAAVLLLSAVVSGQDRPAIREAGLGGPERSPACEGFVEARREFAEMLVAGLTSEELAGRVRGITAEVRLRQAEDESRKLRNAVGAAVAAGRAESDEARRLADRAAAAEAEVRRLRAIGTADAEPPGSWGEGTPARDVLVQELRTRMAEETDLLAATLNDRELERRAAQLRRLVTLARIGSGLRALRQAPPRPAGDGSVPADEIIPAGATRDPEAGSLGAATTAPPPSLGPALSGNSPAAGGGTTPKPR